MFAETFHFGYQGFSGKDGKDSPATSSFVYLVVRLETGFRQLRAPSPWCNGVNIAQMIVDQASAPLKSRSPVGYIVEPRPPY
jgi:hypothetical protein